MLFISLKGESRNSLLGNFVDFQVVSGRSQQTSLCSFLSAVFNIL